MDVDTQNTDPHIHPKYQKIPVNPPYLKTYKPPINDLGLPEKEYFTTWDICKILNLLPDTFRYRLRIGKYPEPKQKAGGKRMFTIDEVKEIARISGRP